MSPSVIFAAIFFVLWLMISVASMFLLRDLNKSKASLDAKRVRWEQVSHAHEARLTEVLAVRADNETLKARNEELEHRHKGYDTLILALEEQRNRWRARYTTQSPRYGAAQSMMWTTIERLWGSVRHLSGQLKKEPPSDIKALVESMKAQVIEMKVVAEAHAAEPMEGHAPSPPTVQKAEGGVIIHGDGTPCDV